ncbi:MAG TPA: ABC transporter ATP-binding protein [Candidatus Ozemobacteraceae bacterium]|nr:ABC transporter ATP-binding protein [Candidatus Ozemobacteraceae bacterium]
MSDSYVQDDEIVGSVYDARLMRRLLPYVRPHLFSAVAAVALVFLGMGMFLVNPWVLGRVVDIGIMAGNSVAVTRLALLYGAIELLVFLAACGQNYLLQYVGQHVMLKLRTGLFHHLLRLPVRFFDRNPVGRLVTRITNDVAALGELFSSGLVVVLGDVVVLVGIAIAMLLLEPVLGLATLATVPLLIASAVYFQRRIRTAYRLVRQRLARLNSTLAENLSGMKIIQMYRRESERAAGFAVLNAGHRDAQLQSLFHHAIFTPVVTLINGLTIVIVLLLGGSMVQNGQISVGVLVSFLAYAQFFFFPIRNISEKVTLFQSAMAAAERVFALMDETEETAIDEGTPPARWKGELVFDHVGFGYEPGRPVLRDVCFRVEAGQSVAIVGHTGAGKTTIASLLQRFYEIDSGSITIDGLDLRSLSKDALRRGIGVIQQDVFIFSGSAIENIRLWDKTLDQQTVARYAKQVQAAAFLRALPGGFDGELYERGANLSTGQRQLLAFARALCADPPILILDEATSAVDTETEKSIQTAIETMAKNRTCLIIAHRLSTIRHCNRILVMHNGRLVEEGSHEQLLARGGHYARLYEIQFSVS